MLDCGEDKPDSDIEYYGLADYDAYRVEELRMAEKSRAVGEGVPLGIGADRPVACALRRRELLARETSISMQLFMPVLNEAGIDLMLLRHEHRYSFILPGSGGTVPDRDPTTTRVTLGTTFRTLIRCRIIGPPGAARPPTRTMNFLLEHSGRSIPRIVGEINVPKEKRAGDAPARSLSAASAIWLCGSC